MINAGDAYDAQVQEQIDAARKQKQVSGKLSQSKPARAKKAKPAPNLTSTLQYESIVQLATPIASVSAFCRAVLSKIIPADFWGKGATRDENKEAVSKKIDHFVRLREVRVDVAA